MNDHTRDEVPGTGQNLDVPLKRDRKLLRSSKPLPPRTAQPTPSAPSVPSVPEELREPEAPGHEASALSPAEQLFAGQWTSSLPSAGAPASTIPPEPTVMPRTPEPAVPAARVVDSPAVGQRPRLEPDDNVRDDEIAADETLPKKKGLFGLSFARKPAAEAPSDADRLVDEEADVEVPDLDGVADYFATSRLPVQQPPTEVFDTPVQAAGYPPRSFADDYGPAHGADSYGAGIHRPGSDLAADDGPAHPRLGSLKPTPAGRHPGLAGLDIAALVTAILLPPIGLIVAIVALIRGKQVRGWASDLARAAISVALIMTVVFTAAGGFVWASETARAEELAQVRAEQRAHDRVQAVSVPFCEVLEANPTIYSTADPDYGWPALDASPSYLSAIAAYSKVWVQIAEAAPAGIQEEASAISQRVAGVVNIATALGSSNRAGDLLGLHEKDDLATVESWYVEYCPIPE